MKTFIVTVFAVAVFFPLAVFGARVAGGGAYTLAEDKIISGNFYVSSSDVVISGKIDGDLIAAGGTVFIDGVVTGDVLVAGGTVAVSGAIGGDVRAAAATVTISGTVGGDVLVFSGTAKIVSGAAVGGDVIAFAGALTVEAPVARGVKAAGGSAVINADVGGNVFVSVNDLEFGERAVISGTATSFGLNPPLIRDGAVFRSGSVEQKEAEGADDFRRRFAQFAWLVAGLKFLMAIASAAAVFAFFKPAATHITRYVTSHFFAAFGYGLLAVVGIPLVGILLMASLVGIPLGAMVFALYVSVLLLAGVFGGMALGAFAGMLFDRKTDARCLSWYEVLGGTVVFSLLWFVPVVGWVVRVAFFLAGLGALSRALYRLLSHRSVPAT